jgi:hypothetical protein
MCARLNDYEERWSVTKSVGNVAALNDADIRSRLTDWLSREFAHDGSTVVYHEFAVPRPSARADVAVVNGRLSGFEIKSDLDTFSRLPQQIASYSAVFERVTLVTTAGHLEKAIAYIPAWWGILVAHPNAPLSLIRPARMNREVDVKKAMYLLSCAELQEIAWSKDCAFSTKSRKSHLIDILCQAVSKTKLMEEIRVSLKNRFSQVDHRNRHSSADT